jgi:hypothetical protein
VVVGEEIGEEELVARGILDESDKGKGRAVVSQVAGTRTQRACRVGFGLWFFIYFYGYLIRLTYGVSGIHGASTWLICPHSRPTRLSGTRSTITTGEFVPHSRFLEGNYPRVLAPTGKSAILTCGCCCQWATR